MQRLYQDRDFSVNDVVGCRLLRLCAAYDADTSDDRPIVFYARFGGQSVWHKFFLDLGVAFWDMVDSCDIEEEFNDEAYRISDCLDCSTQYTVQDAFAFVPPNETCAQIRLLLSPRTEIHIKCVHEDENHYMAFSVRQNSR